MATKTFYATRDLKNPGYGTRMLKAGDSVELDGPKSRLYLALGAVSPSRPRTVTSLARADADGSGNLLPTTAPVAAKPKPAPRKRTAKKTK